MNLYKGSMVFNNTKGTLIKEECANIKKQITFVTRHPALVSFKLKRTHSPVRFYIPYFR